VDCEVAKPFGGCFTAVWGHDVWYWRAHKIVKKQFAKKHVTAFANFLEKREKKI
jgi:hypothetical protein